MMTVKECARLLGEAIAKSEEVVAFNAAKNAYETNEALGNAMREYNAQRMILGQEYTKDVSEQDAVLIDTLRARIDELYAVITEAPEYIALGKAQEGVNLLMQSVNSDINFYAFGERPCTHDCSSCSGCSSQS